jgi:hypothetical protein
MLRPRLAIPIHWGPPHPITSALGELRLLAEPAGRHVLAARLAPDAEARVPQPGDETVID